MILAVGAVVLRGDAVLVVRRRNPPRAGAWTLPGGRVQTGETHAQALAREIREETGLEVSVVRFLEAVAIPPYVVLDYLATDAAGEPIAGDDATEARFVDVAELGEIGVTEAVARIVRQVKTDGLRKPVVPTPA